MPLHQEPKRVCFLGDSQMGSLRIALEENLTSLPTGVEVEYWGATGPAFRQIDWQDGAIHATGDALDMALAINGNERAFIAPDDFDTLVFYGARLRVAEFFGSYLDWIDENGQMPSAAVVKAGARLFLNNTRMFRIAGKAAIAGCEVIYVPSPFYTDGIRDLSVKSRFFDAYPGAEKATPEQRAMLWDALVSVAGDDGITLVPQPEDTVIRGSLTKNEFARENALEDDDAGHKCPAFAARWMQDVWPLIQPAAQAA
ncbi:hypothetical protein [Pseudosulfitobacter sp. SM2401]|uniref:hypothetical protein n=1 Tax=Pseudosulfitobacter sp. SM2401 TaxID=3350098 RepID=UPI0036F3D751